MEYKHLLTIQDISCVGQCSLTVALPIISACGIETSVLPSAVLSTHTCGFTGYTFRDLTDDMPEILNHWKKEGIKFDCIYTGYLGSARQIDIVKEIAEFTGSKDCILAVDPAMADNGKLYPAFDEEYVEEMKKLCALADCVLPNITEACLLTNTEYRTHPDDSYLEELCSKLANLGTRTVVLTGIVKEDETNGVAIYENGSLRQYRHCNIATGVHGTGDIFSSAFVGKLLATGNAYTSAVFAADFVLDCIKESKKHKDHTYGAVFEPVIRKFFC